MEPLVLLLGVILGLILVALKANSPEQKEQRLRARLQANRRPTAQLIRTSTSNDPLTYAIPRPYTPLDPYISIRQRMPAEGIPENSQQQAGIMQENVQIIVEKWRKSIVGLIKLADNHLAAAKSHLDLGNYTSAVQDASASVENIARALIHCYGGKPDTEPNQEEALKMLSGRFSSDERAEFENAVEIIANIGYNRIILKYLSTPETRVWLFGETQTKQILECALKIVVLFKRIIAEHFAPEIPELGDACPKCHSLLVTIWGFDRDNETRECITCHNKWIGPRT
ncbi:MAG TPA: HEPN domain-containing protein [Candidatus Bathyarchaeia archaeon]